MKLSNALPLALGLAAGLLIGFIDVGATAVQGTLLLLLVVTFALALVTRLPWLLIALCVGAGLPLAHVIAWLLGGGGAPQVGMLIVIVPLSVAALAGRGVAGLIATASSTIEPEGRTGVRTLSAVQVLGLTLIACTTIGLVPVYATLTARAQPNAWWVATIWQVITFVAWAAATPHVFLRSRRMRATGSDGITINELLSHGLVVLGIATTHAIVLTFITRALLIPFGHARVPGVIAWAFAAYLPIDALTYILLVAVGRAYDSDRQLRAAAACEAAIRGELASTRLASLQAQLRPHFLFNALNAASVLARRGDAARAGDVLSKLSELLRYVLRGAESTDPQSTVRLDEELAFVEAYLAIEHERFADRLRPTIDADNEARRALVPHLVLQPLVENAIQHGVSAKVAAGELRVSAKRRGQELILQVDDDGPGPGSVEQVGIGLTNTRSRLATLYGAAARLTLAPRAAGGTTATIVIPFTSG